MPNERLVSAAIAAQQLCGQAKQVPIGTTRGGAEVPNEGWICKSRRHGGWRDGGPSSLWSWPQFFIALSGSQHTVLTLAYGASGRADPAAAETHSAWHKRWWIDKAARLLRGGEGLGPDDDIQALHGPVQRGDTTPLHGGCALRRLDTRLQSLLSRLQVRRPESRRRLRQDSFRFSQRGGGGPGAPDGRRLLQAVRLRGTFLHGALAQRAVRGSSSACGCGPLPSPAAQEGHGRDRGGARDRGGFC